MSNYDGNQGFCTGSLKYSDKIGQVKCDRHGIPYWESNVTKWENNIFHAPIHIFFVKPYTPKNYVLQNCDYNVGPDNFMNEINCEEAAKSKLCATLIWGMESNTGNGKRIFNKWYQETNSGGFDETDFEWVYGNIVKICSLNKYKYNCKPPKHCSATICGIDYKNGGIGKSTEELADLARCESFSGVTSFVDHNFPSTIHLCPVLYLSQVPELNKNVGYRSRLGILFHEMSHFKFTMANVDNPYHTRTTLNKSSLYIKIDDNAKTFDMFVEDMYQTTTVKTWADVAQLTNKRFSNAVNEQKLAKRCKNSQWKTNKKEQYSKVSNGTDTIVIFLVVIMLLLHL